MSIIKNPWDLGQDEVEKFRVPNFVKAKYIVTNIIPPKGKTIRDGLVVYAALLSYETDGEEVTITDVSKKGEDYIVSFPHGRYPVTATKYRGPKSYYRFQDPTTGKFKLIPQDHFTESYAINYLKENISEWNTLSDIERDVYIDEYFEDLYMFGMANDFAFDTKKDYSPIVPGLVTEFYRRYTPPSKEEKYGNVIITKWPSKKDPVESNYDALDGNFTLVDKEIADAITEALLSKETSNDIPF